MLVAFALSGAVAACGGDVLDTRSRTEGIPNTESGFRKASINEAIIKGWIRTVAKGNGLSFLNLRITLIQKPSEIDDDDEPVDLDLVIEIPEGLYFSSLNPEVQNMVARERLQRTLTTVGESVHISVPVACANMHRKTPSSAHQFRVVRVVDSGELRNLLALHNFSRLDFLIQQIAIWTITNTPSSRGQYMGIGFGISIGGGNNITEEHMQEVRVLFDRAGIDHTNYPSLSDTRPAPLPDAPSAVWEDAKGRKLQAAYIAKTREEVIVAVDRREFKIPLDSLSDASVTQAIRFEAQQRGNRN